jgi:hypothetical protein
MSLKSHKQSWFYIKIIKKYGVERDKLVIWNKDMLTFRAVSV